MSNVFHFANAKQTIVRDNGPSIEFGNGISQSLIWQVLRAMHKNQIIVRDSGGKKLEVKLAWTLR